MLQFIWYKIRKKIVLNLSLFVGVVFLTGFLCVYPMFREGSLDRLLVTMFEDHIAEEGEYPAVLMREDEYEIPEGDAKSDAKAADSDGLAMTLAGDSLTSLIYREMDDNQAAYVKYIDCPVVQNQRLITRGLGNVRSVQTDKSKVTDLLCVPDLEEHVDVVDRSDFDVALDTRELIYPCYLSQKSMDRLGFVAGETVQYKRSAYGDDKPLSFVIVGVVEEKRDDDFFWFKRLADYPESLIVTPEVYDAVMTELDATISDYTQVILLDYRKITHKNADAYCGFLDDFAELDSRFSSNFFTTLKYYQNQKRSIEVILFSGELPIVALLFLFLYMISSRILQMETTEIAMLGSRGISRKRILGIYIRQSALISLAGVLLGVPCGYVFCKVAASATAFLEFARSDNTLYGFTLSTVWFAIFAFVCAVVFITVPVLKLSGMTIIERRSKKTKQRRNADFPAWERYFVDIILMAMSGYLGYNYYGQRDVIALNMLMGKSVDPIIFLNSFVFMFGCGLLFMRLIGYLVKLIYKLGGERWKPAPYTALLQIIRGTKGQSFISVFLVMTIAMGVFNTNIARTMNENMQYRCEYDEGSDLRIEEKWKLKTIQLDSGEYQWSYKEPDFGRYDGLDELGVEKKTKVIIDSNTDFTIGDKVEKGNILMAIHTKEFGETAQLDSNLNEKHWFYYLNELAKNPGGALISSNLAKKYELTVGDKIKYSRYSPRGDKKPYVDSNLTICGIVDAFPGFATYSYVTNEQGGVEEKENYLIVANYATVVNTCKQTPYQIYMKCKPGADEAAIRQYLKDREIELESFHSKAAETKKNRESAMVVISNGMFSLGFAISLVVFCLGFLIYWILTIRERQMQYGIYRAMGVSMHEIVQMLVIEQVFGSLLSALSGFGVGMIATGFFTEVIATVYLPRKHNLPITVVNRAADVGKIGVILIIAFAICFIVMRRDIKKMDITKALKMGDN